MKFIPYIIIALVGLVVDLKSESNILIINTHGLYELSMQKITT